MNQYLNQESNVVSARVINFYLDSILGAMAGKVLIVKCVRIERYANNN